MSKTSTAIECRKLSKTFNESNLPVEVINDVNLQVASGEMVAIVGPSGSGKSTLLHLLGGLEKPTSGEVKIEGIDIHHLSEGERGKLRNQRLGFIYQFHHLLPDFNALENVCVPLLIGGVSTKQARKEATFLLEKVGLCKRQQHRVGELSGGERQRVAIVRALVTKPTCVLADEPTGNLDRQNAMYMYELMSSLNNELGTSFIVVTHDLDMVNRMDRVFTLHDGRLTSSERS